MTGQGSCVSEDKWISAFAGIAKRRREWQRRSVGVIPSFRLNQANGFEDEPA
ncbi:hypothetical protein [Rickettsiales endosymbiont of Peranema trichophorum]|uniref:hypothetical protein n=1 Tax=Rickettsiales endosymbiont of Peranema trichophorum TaxID=2486577 RepID=UPI0013EE5CE4|nr:hypothetical protein [Rickettsiales endosymbiont of Peranema trichophorum]